MAYYFVPKTLSSISLVGTTSCGKSTIGNLLSGRYILPSGVQETTTSVVEICHMLAYQTSTIKLMDASNINLYKYGYFDTEIRTSVNQVMTSTNAVNPFTMLQLSMNVKPEKWQQLVTHNFHKFILKRQPLLAELNITEGFTVRDFPGLQYEKDTNRLHLIEKHLDKKGLIFFIFNAEETDSVKEDKLLKKLFDLLHHQKSDWQNVLFILNRKDAFYRDDNPESSLQKAIQARRARIKTLIQETWQNKLLDSKLNIIPLSAGLVFATEMLCWPNDFTTEPDRQYFKEYIAKQAICLLPDKIRKNLPRQVNRWHYWQWLKIYQAMYFNSGLNELVQTLKSKRRVGRSGALFNELRY